MTIGQAIAILRQAGYQVHQVRSGDYWWETPSGYQRIKTRQEVIWQARRVQQIRGD